jgi:class 3 adenylate cyclase
MTDNAKMMQALARECERIEEDSIHSAKGHFNAGNTWRRRHYWIGIPATVLGAGTGAAIVKGCPELAGLLSLAATILTALVTFLKPSERASAHKTAGDQYLALRNDTRFFREIQMLQPEESCNHSEELRALAQRRNELNQGSPEIPRRAFLRARQGIDEGETQYRTDKEKP